MHNSAFTPEELAELAAFDAMVDEEPITQEEIEASRIRDRAAKLDRLDHRKKQIAAYQREYYQAHREARAAYQREYYQAHREAIAAQKREYYQANREAIAAYQREYWAKKKGSQK